MGSELHSRATSRWELAGKDQRASEQGRDAPGEEAVEVVPELVVEPGRPGLGQAGLVEAAEHLRVHLELVALLLLLLPRLRRRGGRRGGRRGPRRAAARRGSGRGVAAAAFRGLLHRHSR